MEDSMHNGKSFRIFYFYFFVIAILFYSGINLFAVEVDWVSGDVNFRHLVGDWQPLDVGIQLTNGDVIKTGLDGEASLIDGDAFVKILPDSKFTISERFQKEKHRSSFMLFLGRLKFKLTKQSSNEPEIVTQAVNLTIRGTEFDVASGHDGSTLVVIENGVVAVSGKENTLILNNGEGSQVKFGEEPTEKFKVLTKVIDWDKWLVESRENIKGREGELLTRILKKFQGIDSEIKNYEKIRSDSLKRKDEDLRLRNAKLAENNNEEATLYSKKAGLEGKKAFHSIVNIRFLALSSIGLKDMADSIFSTIERPSKHIKDVKSRIDNIYSAIKEKYIKQGDRERLEKKSKKKKGCLGLF